MACPKNCSLDPDSYQNSLEPLNPVISIARRALVTRITP